MNIKELFSYNPKQNYDFELKSYNMNLQYRNSNINSNKTIDSNIEINLNTIKTIYNTEINSDIITRDFTIVIENKEYQAFLLYIDGMIDSKSINNFVLSPLMLDSNVINHPNLNNLQYDKNNPFYVKIDSKSNLEDYIYNSLIPQNNLKKENSLTKLIEGVNSGNCALFVDTLNIGFNIDVKGFKQRSINTPKNENIINGPQEAFVENIRVNTSLLRKIINNENLIIENLSLGEISKTSLAICYMKNITNPNLLKELKYRLNNIKLDSLLSTGQLVQLLEEKNSINVPTLIETERPDKCAKSIMQGRCVVLVNGNPYAIILPGILIDFISSPEDTNLKPLFANFLKILRILAYFVTLLVPGIFIAITGFHHELLPTELLFSILASRENVPFPIIFELLIMEISFELIRESGIRIPAPIGSTIGIIGAIILGDAAVSAHIVSPILIIIVAITGLSSFAIPDFAFSFHLRVYRFAFILLGYIAGFVGIGAGLLIYLNILCNISSFGVNYASPLTDSLYQHYSSIFVKSAWKKEKRVPYMKPIRKFTQPKISKKWLN